MIILKSRSHSRRSQDDGKHLGRIIQASDIFRKTMYELILIQESLINDIDKLIKHSENNKKSEEFFTNAVEKFIESATQEKIQRHSKRV